MSGHILIVEDRQSLRRMLERALAGEGHRVTAVQDGEAAVDHLEQTGFDLVLTDLKLPGITGLEVLAASRRSQPATPVVVLTGRGDEELAVVRRWLEEMTAVVTRHARGAPPPPA